MVVRHVVPQLFDWQGAAEHWGRLRSAVGPLLARDVDRLADDEAARIFVTRQTIDLFPAEVAEEDVERPSATGHDPRRAPASDHRLPHRGDHADRLFARCRRGTRSPRTGARLAPRSLRVPMTHDWDAGPVRARSRRAGSGDDLLDAVTADGLVPPVLFVGAGRAGTRRGCATAPCRGWRWTCRRPCPPRPRRDALRTWSRTCARCRSTRRVGTVVCATA